MGNRETAERRDEKSGEQTRRTEKKGEEERRVHRVERTWRGNEPLTMTITTSRKGLVFVCAGVYEELGTPIAVIAYCQREDDLGPGEIKTRLCVVEPPAEGAGIRISSFDSRDREML